MLKCLLPNLKISSLHYESGNNISEMCHKPAIYFTRPFHIFYDFEILKCRQKRGIFKFYRHKRNMLIHNPFYFS